VLRRLRDYEGFEVWSRDQRELGRVQDFYFDEEMWTVRYIVVKTGSWLTGRSVLLSPMSLDRVRWNDGRLDFTLTEDQITRAPDADLTKPLTRNWEEEYSAHYGMPHYWTGSDVWGMWATPMDVPPLAQRDEMVTESRGGEHLRSIRDVSGYHIHAQDGEIGHVEDFMSDDRSWKIRYLMIDTSNWIGGRTVLLPPDWASGIDWVTHRIDVDVTREMVQESPEYDPAADIDGKYEQRLAESYRRGQVKSH
jgi:sporulation protein YlmC with PRC-barrel domain